MKTKKLIDKLILDKNEIIIPWKTLLLEDAIFTTSSPIQPSSPKSTTPIKSISISCWIYITPLENDMGDNDNKINRIFSQQQENQTDCGIFFGSTCFDKRLYNDSSPLRTTIDSTYLSNKDELKYYNWEFLIFKLNFNDDGTKLISTEIYLNCKIYKQTNFNCRPNNVDGSDGDSNTSVSSGGGSVGTDELLSISKYPLVIGSNDLTHQVMLSDLTIHFNDRHDILPILSSSSILKPIYPPNIQNRNLIGIPLIRTIKPINSLLELINWNKSCKEENNLLLFGGNNGNNSLDNFPINVSTIKLNKRSNGNNDGGGNLINKRIHCHDMMNGYQMDRYCQGIYDDVDSNQQLWSAPYYNFYQWNLIDIFIYFTHHRISIPPVGWINAAHKNGVQVLGTIIFEWDQSLQDSYLLVDGIPESSDFFIEKLVKLAKYFQFDGWFLNLETCLLDRPEYVGKYQNFLSKLTSSVHKYIGNESLVIWYDSVINNGELNWQNSLNEKNLKFFDACDGIFLNYCWKKHLLKESFQFSNNRSKDVYVGTDVWGRGTYGGGGLNSWIGLKEADSHHLSSAIFAPGWTFENTNSSNKMVIEKERSLWLGCLISNLIENGSAENGNFSTWSIDSNNNSDSQDDNNNNNNNPDRYRWVIDNNGLLNGGKSFKCEKVSRFDKSYFLSFRKRIDLQNSKNGYYKEILDQLPVIEFEFYFRSKNNKRDSNNYPVNLIMLDENSNVLKEFNTQCLSKSGDNGNWKKYKITIQHDYPVGIRFIDIVVVGNNNCEISITGIHLQIIGRSKYVDDLDDPTGSIKSVTSDRISVCSLPFSTCFNRGKGKRYFLNGKLVSNEKWFNLSDQDITGSEEDYRYQYGSSLINLSTCYNVSFNGGSSLNIKGKLEIIKVETILNNISSGNVGVVGRDNNNGYSISTLFKSDIKFNMDEQQELSISYTWTTKPLSNSTSSNCSLLKNDYNKLCLILVFSGSGKDEKNFKNVILHPSTLGTEIQQEIFPFTINENNGQNQSIIYESDQDEIIIGHNNLNWYQSKFSLNISDFIFNSNDIKLVEIKSFSYNFKSTCGNRDSDVNGEDGNGGNISGNGINEFDGRIGNLNQYNIYIGEITLDSNNNGNNIVGSNSEVQITSCDIDKIWNMKSLKGNLDLDLFDLVLNWNVTNNNNNNNSLVVDKIKFTNIYLDKKWIGKSYNNNFYFIKCKPITQNSIITLELVNHINISIYSKDFNVYNNDQ